jgi:hypothetical protein
MACRACATLGCYGLTISARSRRDAARCSDCHHRSTAVHGYDRCRPADLPLLGRCVRLELDVLRFCCTTASCSADVRRATGDVSRASSPANLRAGTCANSDRRCPRRRTWSPAGPTPWHAGERGDNPASCPAHAATEDIFGGCVDHRFQICRKVQLGENHERRNVIGCGNQRPEQQRLGTRNGQAERRKTDISQPARPSADMPSRCLPMPTTAPANAAPADSPSKY